MKTNTVNASWISKQPDRCGGDACIRDRRIPVWVIVNSRRLGATEAQILEDYPALTPADLQSAWKYYESNMEEINRAIRENEEGEEGLVESFEVGSPSAVLAAMAAEPRVTQEDIAELERAIAVGLRSPATITPFANQTQEQRSP
jgi:uncharacterized protein (DUF433 family)